MIHTRLLERASSLLALIGRRPAQPSVCTFCDLTYEDHRAHCVACGFPVVQRET